MSFKAFKQVGDGFLRLDLELIVGVGDGGPGRSKIWLRGQAEPFEVEGEPDDIQLSIERDRLASRDHGDHQDRHSRPDGAASTRPTS